MTTITVTEHEKREWSGMKSAAAGRKGVTI